MNRGYDAYKPETRSSLKGIIFRERSIIRDLVGLVVECSDVLLLAAGLQLENQKKRVAATDYRRGMCLQDHAVQFSRRRPFPQRVNPSETAKTKHQTLTPSSLSPKAWMQVNGSQ